MHHAADEIDYRTVLLKVDGKLRGSRARRLGEDLESLFADGFDQVVIDLRGASSLDSVFALGLGRALEVGQRLLLVIEPGERAEDFLPPEIAYDPRLRVFDDASDAVRYVRSREESGVLVP